MDSNEILYNNENVCQITESLNESTNESLMLNNLIHGKLGSNGMESESRKLLGNSVDTRENDCLSHSSSDWSDKKSSTDSLDWSRTAEDRIPPAGRNSRCKWHTEHKLSSDSGVAGVSQGGSSSADDLFEVLPSHSNNSLSDWKKSIDSLSANKSTDNVSLYSSGNNKSTDNSLSLIKSVDSLSVNKSLDSLNINDATNSRHSLGSVNCEWSADGANDKDIDQKNRNYSYCSDIKYLESELKLVKKSLSDQKSKLREWKSRTNVSCDINWKEFNEDQGANNCGQDQINLSCDMLDRLSWNYDCIQYGAGGSRSTESIYCNKKDTGNNFTSTCEKRSQATVGFFAASEHPVVQISSDGQYSGRTSAVLSPMIGGHYGSPAPYLDQDAVDSTTHTPTTPKSSQHSLFSNSTPNSLSMTPNSSSLASDSLLDTPDSLSNQHLNSYNLINNSPNSISNNCDVYVTPKSLPRTPLTYTNTPNSLNSTPCPNNQTTYSNTPDRYPNNDNVYSGTPISYNTSNPSYLNSFYHTPDAYLEASANLYSQYSCTPYNGELYPSTATHSVSSAPQMADQPYSPPSQFTAQTTAAGTGVSSINSTSVGDSSSNNAPVTSNKGYDYLLKFLLVGDSDVGKHEILGGLEDGAVESPYCVGSGHKSTVILLDGKRVKLQLWDTSGQGRFCTIIRSYSRGAQGILLVYDVTNKWSFEGLDRWMVEIQEHAPGVPKVLLGNRLHLAFKRQVSQSQAEQYAARNRMSLFEVSPLCDFNVVESFTELSRLALKRNGMERLWRANKVLPLQELCCRTIVGATSVYGIDRLPLPPTVRSHLKSYTSQTCATRLRQGIPVTDKHKKKHLTIPGDCINKDHNSSSCVNTSTCVIT